MKLPRIGLSDFERTWEGLSDRQRIALLDQIPPDHTNARIHAGNVPKDFAKHWAELPARVMMELVKLDWEFSLGEKLWTK
jgi:hypothetical protein